MQKNQDHSPEEALGSLHDFIDALSNHSDIPNREDHRFVHQLPFMLAGAFDAKNVPMTKENVEEAFNIIDPDGRESFYNIDPNYKTMSENAFKEAETASNDDEVDETPEEKAKNEARFEAFKKRLEAEGLFSESGHHKENPVEKVVIAALRSDSRFAGIETNEDVIKHAKDILERLVRQQLERLNIPAEHKFWSLGGLNLLALQHKENTIDTTLEIARQQKAHAIEPPEPH